MPATTQTTVIEKLLASAVTQAEALQALQPNQLSNWISAIAALAQADAMQRQAAAAERTVEILEGLTNETSSTSFWIKVAGEVSIEGIIGTEEIRP